MPAKTKKQMKFMAAVAHNKQFAKKVGVPQSVGREFDHMAAKMYPPKVTAATKDKGK